MKTRRGPLTYFLLFAGLASSLEAQCGDVLFYVQQESQEHYFQYGEEIVLNAGEPGILRMFYRSQTRSSPASTTAEIADLKRFGYRGPTWKEIQQVFPIKAQNDRNRDNGKVDFAAPRVGTTSLGYRLIRVKNERYDSQVPKKCRTGEISVRVVAPQRAPGPPTGHNPPSATLMHVGGPYSTEWGELVLRQAGTRVEGHFEHRNGRVEGTMTGNILRGTWSQEPSYQPPNEAGSFELTFRRVGSNVSFQGVWRYGQRGDWSGQWNGTLKR